MKYLFFQTIFKRGKTSPKEYDYILKHMGLPKSDTDLEYTEKWLLRMEESELKDVVNGLNGKLYISKMSHDPSLNEMMIYFDFFIPPEKISDLENWINSRNKHPLHFYWSSTVTEPELIDV